MLQEFVREMHVEDLTLFRKNYAMHVKRIRANMGGFESTGYKVGPMATKCLQIYLDATKTYLFPQLIEYSSQCPFPPMLAQLPWNDPLPSFERFLGPKLKEWSFNTLYSNQQHINYCSWSAFKTLFALGKTVTNVDLRTHPVPPKAISHFSCFPNLKCLSVTLPMTTSPSHFPANHVGIRDVFPVLHKLAISHEIGWHDDSDPVADEVPLLIQLLRAFSYPALADLDVRIHKATNEDIYALTAFLGSQGPAWPHFRELRISGMYDSVVDRHTGDPDEEFLDANVVDAGTALAPLLGAFPHLRALKIGRAHV